MTWLMVEPATKGDVLLHVHPPMDACVNGAALTVEPKKLIDLLQQAEAAREEAEAAQRAKAMAEAAAAFFFASAASCFFRMMSAVLSALLIVELDLPAFARASARARSVSRWLPRVMELH